MKKAQIYFAIISMVVLGLIYSLNYPSPKLRPVFQTVNFCGTSYQVEKVMIDDTDIIKRIAELATAKPESGVCPGVKNNFAFGNETKLDSRNSNFDEYWLSFSSLFFIFQPERNKIFIEDAFAGHRTYFGTIK